MTTTEDDATPVPTSLLTVTLSWRSAHALDAHALLLAGHGRVRSTRDAVYFNAPRHPSQAVTLDQCPQPRTARLSVSLPRTEPEVQRIVLSASVRGDVAGESMSDVADLTVSVLDAAGLVARCDVPAAAIPGTILTADSTAPPMGSTVRAIALAEFFRSGGLWRFRPVGAGWAELADLFTDFGVRTQHGAGLDRDRISLRRSRFGDDGSEAPTPAPPDPDRADWHPQGSVLRWWDGTQWMRETAPLPPPRDARVCPRCGRRRGWRVLGSPAPCRACAAEIEEYLTGWRARAWRVLTGTGPRGAAWDELWTALRHQHIPAGTGRTALRGPGLAYVERLAAFADGELSQDDLHDFEDTVAALALSGPLVQDLRRRMHRARTLTRLRTGELPVVRATGLHLDPEERVHLDVTATRVRMLARGEHRADGRLICSDRKLRFVGPEAGIEMPWPRIVSVSTAEGMVGLAATSARGGAEFEVEDPDLVAAVLEGALRVAKRLTLTPGRRDSRAVPPEIKAQVWRRDGGACTECGATHYLEFDHIIPLSRGGATSPANLQILCRSCNRAKGSRI
jgi:stress response protein SCP2